MRWDKDAIKTGMFVEGTHGERVGKVIRCDPDTFVVEKGVFFPKDYELRYDHITELKDGKIIYSLTDFLRREEVTRERAAREEARAPATGGLAAAAVATAPRATTTEETTTATTTAREPEPLREPAARDGETIRIPLMEEEMGVEKFSRESGHVRIHKSVKTEEKHFTVPVRREEITIEHVSVARETVQEREASFEEQTVDLPLHEEELRVTKRPRMREEVVVRTVARAVDKEGSTTLRHEEVEVEDSRKTAPSASREQAYNTPGSRR